MNNENPEFPNHPQNPKDSNPFSRGNPADSPQNWENPEEFRENSGDLRDAKTYIPSTAASNPSITGFESIRSQYQQVTRKSNIIQIIGASFALITLLIELFIYRLARRMNFVLDRVQLFRFVGIFIILFFISALAIIQFVVIYRWNRMARTTSHYSLTQSQYHIIGQIQFIRILIVLTILLLGYFFYIYRHYLQLPPAPHFPVIFRIYKSLLRISALLCFIYLLFEMGQLFIWSKRNRMISRIERQIARDIPNLDELSRLLADDDPKL